jgi:hypothetical protein
MLLLIFRMCRMLGVGVECRLGLVAMGFFGPYPAGFRLIRREGSCGFPADTVS